MTKENRVISVWLIDDDAYFIKAMTPILVDDLGYKVKGFRSARDFHEEKRQNCSPPDIILLDMALGTQHGTDLVEPIRRWSSHPKILIYTSYDNEEYLVNALRSRANGYIMKGGSIEELRSAIDAAIRGEMPYDPYVIHKIVKLIPIMSGRFPGAQLTQSETAILDLISQGFSFSQIARELNISYHTVNFHAKNIYRKLDVGSRAEAAAKVFNVDHRN